MIRKFYIISISLMLYIQSGWALPLAFTGYVTPVTCHGLSDGIIDIQITGGVGLYEAYIDIAPYGYVSSSHPFPGLPAGLHTIYVKDNIDEINQTFFVVEPVELIVTGSIVPSNCPTNGNIYGAINLTVTGGVSVYQYVWNNGVTTQNISGLDCDPAVYSVTVTDANGCSASGSWIYAGDFTDEDVCNGGASSGGSITFNSPFCCIDSPYCTWTTNSATPGFPRNNWDIFNLQTGDYFLKVDDLSPSHQITRYETFHIDAKKSTCSANYLQNLIVLPGEDNCYDAGGAIYVAGNGTNFTVQSGGTATLIAGEKISFLPGTRVYPGGSMYGYITTTGQFCGNKSGSGNGNGEGIATDTLPNPSFTGNQVFRVYPNPTTGSFILELNGDNNDSNIQADIYSMKGEKIVAAELKGEKKHEFSLAGYPQGLYFIRVVNGKSAGTVKIVRQ